MRREKKKIHFKLDEEKTKSQSDYWKFDIKPKFNWLYDQQIRRMSVSVSVFVSGQIVCYSAHSFTDFVWLCYIYLRFEKRFGWAIQQLNLYTCVRSLIIIVVAVDARFSSFSSVFATIERSSCFSFCARMSTEICMNVSCVSHRCCCCCDRRNSAHELHGSLRFSIYLFSQLNAGSVVERVRHAITTRQMCVHRSWVLTTKIDNRPKPTTETKPGPSKYAQKKRKRKETESINERFKPQNWVIILTKLKFIQIITTAMDTQWMCDDELASEWWHCVGHAYSAWYTRLMMSQHIKCVRMRVREMIRKQIPIVTNVQVESCRRQKARPCGNGKRITRSSSGSSKKKLREREHVWHRKEMRNKIYKIPKASTENGLPNRNHINLIIVLPTALDNF